MHARQDIRTLADLAMGRGRRLPKGSEIIEEAGGIPKPKRKLPTGADVLRSARRRGT